MTRNELFLKSAEYYIKSGFSLIPVGGNKIPLIPWKIYQEKKATLDEIQGWLNSFPEMQLGVVTGKISNIIVVDIEKGGNTDWLPKTAIAETGGGGFHYYYSYVPGMKNAVRIKDLVDIRSDGGYVVIPPSSTDKGRYKWLVKERPQVFPIHLFEKGTEIDPKNYISEDGPRTDYPGYGPGQRNNEMAKWIGHLLAKIHPSEWDNIAWLLSIDANKKNSPPLTQGELQQTFNSIKNLEKRNNNDRWYKKEKTEQESDVWKEIDNKVMPMRDIAAMERYKEGDRYSTKIPIFDTALGGGVEDGDLIIVSGASGFGKTSFVQNLAVNFAEQGLPVLFLSYEVKISHLWQKFKEMGNIDSLQIYSVQKNTTGNIGWIEEKIKEAKEGFDIKFVIIDHLGFLMPKSSMGDISKNYSVYIGQVCRDLKVLALKENIIIIMPVHIRKTEDTPDMNSLANSAGISQESDVVIILHREKNNSGGINIYSDDTRIMMVKNRKTGQNVQGYFKFEHGRFVINDWHVTPESSTRIKQWVK